MAYLLDSYWDAAGQKLYETGIDHGVLFLYNSTAQHGTNYYNGVAWNGLTSVTQSPSGAEANDIYADNIKYLSLRSAEQFGATIEAYTYPDEFAECDGSIAVVPGVVVSQQARKKFGFSYRTRIGNDEKGDDYGYKIHLVYGGTVNPSEKAYQTVNDSPEAITFSWELSTEPVPTKINNVEYRPIAHLEIDSTKFKTTEEKAALAAFEQILYGTPGSTGTNPVTEVKPYMPLPEDVVSALTVAQGGGSE